MPDSILKQRTKQILEKNKTRHSKTEQQVGKTGPHLKKKIFLAACGILFPQSWVKPTAPAVEAVNLNYWTAREVSGLHFLFGFVGGS